MGLGKYLGTNLGVLGSRSPSYRSGTDFSLSHDKVRAAHPVAAKLGRYIPLVMLLSETFFTNFFLKFQMRFWEWDQSKSGICYILAKMLDCHETKSNHIDWTLGLKWDHRVWPWSWPWPSVFKVQYVICYISAKNGPIGTKQKTNISIKF